MRMVGVGSPASLEDPVKSGSYLRICPGAFDGLMKKRCSRGPKRQVRGKQQKRSVGHFVEGKDSTRPNQSGQGAQCGNRIREKLQNEPAHGSVEEPIARNFTCIGLREADVMQACFIGTNPSPGDRRGVALYPNDLSRRADQSG